MSENAKGIMEGGCDRMPRDFPMPPFVPSALPESFWLVFYHDWSGFAVFADELEARRFGDVEMPHAEVMPVPFGVSVHEWVNESNRRSQEAQGAREEARRA